MTAKPLPRESGVGPKLPEQLRGYKGPEQKELGELAYAVTEAKKKFARQEFAHAVPLDTPNREELIDKLVTYANTGPSKEAFFAARTKAEFQAQVIGPILEEQKLSAPQRAEAEAWAEQERVMKEKQTQAEAEATAETERALAQMQAKKAREAIFAAPEGDAPEVVDQSELAQTKTYQPETVVIAAPEEVAEDEPEVVAHAELGKAQEYIKDRVELPEHVEELPESVMEPLEETPSEMPEAMEKTAAEPPAEAEPFFGGLEYVGPSEPDKAPVPEAPPQEAALSAEEQEKLIEQAEKIRAELEPALLAWRKEVTAASETLDTGTDIIPSDPREIFLEGLQNPKNDAEAAVFKQLRESSLRAKAANLLDQLEELNAKLAPETKQQAAK